MMVNLPWPAPRKRASLRPERRPPARVPAVAAVLSILVGAACGKPSPSAGVANAEPRLSGETAEVRLPPDPDLSPLETQVAAKIRSHRQAVLESPTSAESWGRLGMVFQSHEMWQEALPCYRRAAELDPEEFRWPYLLAHDVHQEDPELSLRYLERAMDLRPGFAPAGLLRAGLLEELGRSDSAFEQYQEILAARPQLAGANFGLGRLYLERGDAESALLHLQRALELQPEAASIHASLARAYRLTGDAEAAARAADLARREQGQLALDDPVMVEMLEEAVSSAGYRQRGQRAAFAGEWTKAESLLRKALELRGEEADVHFELAGILARAGRLEEAMEGYREALRIDPRHESAAIRLAILLTFQPSFVTADVDEAIALLRGVLSARPDDGELHFHLAVALARGGDHRTAWVHVKKARELGEPVPPGFLDALRQQQPEPPDGEG